VNDVGYIGVVGAGVMGTGVAEALARVSEDVVLVDLSDAALRAARDAIFRSCRLGGLLGSKAVDPQAVVDRIRLATSIEDVAECDFVVENIVEDFGRKAPVYADLDRVCRPDTILIANTSAIPITRLASLTGRADRVIGVHFMNPVPQKPAVELIPGFHTSSETVDATTALLALMGKKAIPVRDASGFVSNRVLMLTINEAAFLLHEGTASATTVDEVFRSCFGHPMGPLETADLIGLDTILLSLEVLLEHYADPKFRPSPNLRELVAAGCTGRKSGRGFHHYSEATPPIRTPEMT
jgi:3-hydroxybutyryl-CoA dehydrogenase